MGSLLEVQPDTAAKIHALAEQKGISIDAYLRSLLEKTQGEQAILEAELSEKRSLEEFRATLDALVAHPSEANIPYNGTYSREDIYFEHN